MKAIDQNRERIARDLKSFLKSGGKIEKLSGFERVQQKGGLRNIPVSDTMERNKSKALEMARAGRTIEDIAYRMDVSKQAVYKWLKT